MITQAKLNQGVDDMLTVLEAQQIADDEALVILGGALCVMLVRIAGDDVILRNSLINALITHMNGGFARAEELRQKR